MKKRWLCLAYGNRAMLHDVVDVRVLEGHRLHLRFDDGAEGVVDVSQCVRFEGVFAPLEDTAEFAKMTADPELKTVVWPCGADLDPDVLHSLITGDSPAGAPARQR